jgi:hypothetical protein
MEDQTYIVSENNKRPGDAKDKHHRAPYIPALNQTRRDDRPVLLPVLNRREHE